MRAAWILLYTLVAVGGVLGVAIGAHLDTWATWVTRSCGAVAAVAATTAAVAHLHSRWRVEWNAANLAATVLTGYLLVLLLAVRPAAWVLMFAAFVLATMAALAARTGEIRAFVGDAVTLRKAVRSLERGRREQ